MQNTDMLAKPQKMYLCLIEQVHKTGCLSKPWLNIDLCVYLALGKFALALGKFAFTLGKFALALGKFALALWKFVFLTTHFPLPQFDFISPTSVFLNKKS
jgi:hypothetical protein